MKSFAVVFLMSVCCSLASAAAIDSRQAALTKSFSDMLNQLFEQQIKPLLNQAVQAIAEFLAQTKIVNAMPGIVLPSGGKRSTDDLQKQLTKAWYDQILQIISGPITQALQTTAELAAQATAAIAIGGIPAIQSLIGKRSVDEIEIKQLTKAWYDQILQIISGPITQALQTTAELAAQATAAIAIGGIPAIQSLIGKRSAEEVEIQQLTKAWYDQILQIISGPITQALQTTAELAAQATAAIAIGGIPAIQSLIGKRSVEEIEIQQLTKAWYDEILQIVSGPITQALQTTAELAAQATAAIAIGGIPALQSLIG
jgi:molybdopterin-binding protein